MMEKEASVEAIRAADSMDYGGVAPVRRAEIKRRVAILLDYLAITKPTKADKALYAAQMGVGIQQLYNIQRAWKANPSPEAMAGTWNKTRRYPRRSSSIPIETERTAERVLKHLPASSSLREATKLIKPTCEAQGLQAPRRSHRRPYSHPSAPARHSDYLKAERAFAPQMRPGLASFV